MKLLISYDQRGPKAVLAPAHFFPLKGPVRNNAFDKLFSRSAGHFRNENYYIPPPSTRL